MTSPLGENGKATRRELLHWAGWFWFLTATLVMVIGLRYPLVAGFPQSVDSGLFFVLMTLSHWHTLVYLVVPVIFIPLILLYPASRLVKWLAMVLATLAISMVVVDAVSFSLYRFHLNGMVFSLLFGGAGDEIFVFESIVYLTAFAGLMGIVFIVWLLDRLAQRIVRRDHTPRLGYLFATLIFLSFIGQNFWFALANASGNHEITRQARLYPAYLPTRADKELLELGLVEEKDLSNRMGKAAGIADYPKSPLACEAPPQQPNIFVVVVDSWRFDAMSEKITPNIHALTSEAMVFNRHYSGGNNTRTGFFSLMYGIPATYWEDFLDARVGSSLINILQAQGYQMAIYASAKLTGPEFDKTVFADVEGLRKRTMADTVYGRDELANREFIDYLKGTERREPLFGLLFYDAPHSAASADNYRDHFQPAEPVNYLTLTDESDPAPLLNYYRNSVISVDALLGDAFAAIKAAGLWEDAIIVVTGDHSQEFNDNGLGYWGHNGNYTDPQVHVPFIVKWPGRGAEQINYTTTHYDLVPTLMREVLGCRNEVADYSVGTSLFSDEPREPFLIGGFIDIGVRLEREIYSFDQFGGYQVLDLKNKPLQVAPDSEIIKQTMEQTSRYYHR